ncbi:MAG: thioredoxin family protein [Verrucomicrobiota bacterium]
MRLVLFLGALLIGFVQAAPAEDPLITPSISASVPAVTAGESFDVIIELKIKEGWHTYWQYAGDAGFPPTIAWQLPPGWNAGPLKFSLPEQFSEPGNMTIYGYEKSSFLKSTITPTQKIIPKTLFPIEATLSWLACRESCVPGSSHLSLILPSAGGDTSTSILNNRPLSREALWPALGGPPFSFSLVAQGENEIICFEGREGSRYELFPDPPAEMKVGKVMTTETQGHYVMMVPWQKGVAFHGLLVETKKDGSKLGWWISPNLPHTVTCAPQRAQHLQAMPASWKALLAALFFGFLGGLILNLMPCVLPVISLKIFGFIAQARESRPKIFRHGLAFIAGIYVWFLALGLLILLLKASGQEVTWAFQFQNSLFLIVISSLIFLFALNLFGVFEMILPGAASNSLDQLASKEGYLGSFFQGLFATLLATPCTAPFLGSALGFAFAQSGIVIIVIFCSIATGMALPFFFLSFNPAWVKWVPRRGPWMEHLKQFMGFPLIATNIWLLGVLGRQHGASGVLLTLVLLLFLGISAWIYGLFYAAKKEVRWGALSFSFSIALLSFWMLVPKILSSVTKPSALSEGEMTSLSPIASDEIQWIPYSATRLAELRSQGKPVFLDFTAAWCLTCQFNERTAINTAAVRMLLREHHIVPMKADWTNANPEITQALKQFNRVGIPYYVYYPPGVQSEPILFSELLFENALVKAFSRD